MDEALLAQLKSSFGADGYIYAIPAEDAEALPVEGYRIELNGQFYACVQQSVDFPGWDLLHTPE